MPEKIALSVCSPALKIKCSAPCRSAANLLQMLVKTSEETFSLVMCQKKRERKVSAAPLNISTSQQQGAELALGYIFKAQMSSVTKKNDETNFHAFVCERRSQAGERKLA